MLTHATNGIRNFVIVTGEHGGEAAMRNTHTYAQAATYAKNIWVRVVWRFETKAEGSCKLFHHGYTVLKYNTIVASLKDN